MKNRWFGGLGLMMGLGAAAVACSAPDGAEEDAGELAFALQSGETDFTPTAEADVVCQRGSAHENEACKHVIDRASNGSPDVTTKYWMEPTSGWIQYRMQRPTIVTSYDIYTGNDEPQRDPREWKFYGSLDGFSWVELDSREAQTFPEQPRGQARNFPIVNTTPYLFYKLDIKAVQPDQGGKRAGGDLQLSHFAVGGRLPSGTVPGTITAAPQVTLSGTTATITWSQASNATGYYVQRVGDDGESLVQFAVTGSTTSLTDSNLSPGTPYLYQVQPFNGSLRARPSPVSARIVTALPASQMDLTALSAAAPTSNKPAGNAREIIANVTDNTPFTKYFTFNNQATLEQTTPASSQVKYYTITSANDEPIRDPKSWVLQGVKSDGTLITLDTRTDQTFGGRYQRRVFSTNSQASLGFTRYQLVILGTNGSGDLQLSEWRLHGTMSNYALSKPDAPSTPSAEVVSPHMVKLTWQDKSGKLNPESSFVLEAATDQNFSAGLVTSSTGPGSTKGQLWGLTPNTNYFFRVKAVNAAGFTASGTVSRTTSPFSGPPDTWQENWHNNSRLLYKRPSTSNVAFYIDQYLKDDKGETTADWLIPYLDQAVARIKTTYGSLGDPLIYVIANQDKDGLEHPPAASALHFHPESAYRNVAFSTGDDWRHYTDSDKSDWFVESLTHEMGHIVESMNNGIHGSPSNPVWGDDRFADILHWDLFLNMTEHRPNFRAEQKTRMLDKMKDDNSVQWFKNLWLPLYDGLLGNPRKGSAIMPKYFELLAQNLPQIDGTYGYDDGADHRYGNRELNLGEFIHFLSGAAGVDLEERAKQTFRWTPEVELEFVNAQLAYPAVLALYRSSCTPETNAQFCTRVGATCGSVTAADNCGTTRTVSSCGSCTSPETCGGGGTPNVCGGGTSNTPCSSLCSNAVTYSSAPSRSNVGTGAVCDQTSVNLAGISCSQFMSRGFKVNGATVTCDAGSQPLPAKRNGGYCIQANAGDPSWAGYTTW